MARLEELFAARAKENKKVLIAYLAVGDPSVEESTELALACAEAGADAIELGVPFSDPTADGPAIAQSSQRAIRAGGGLTATLAAAAKIRKASKVPLVLFGYYNPLFVRGEVAAVDAAADAGVDGLLVVDLPLDEGMAFRDRARDRGLAVIPLLTPTSSRERIGQVKEQSGSHPAGFIYYVSVTGVTGSSKAPLADASAAAGDLRRTVGLPTVVGFGIDSAEKALTAAAHADGIVVGTAIVRRIEQGASSDARRRDVMSLVAQIRSALDAGPSEREMSR
jgi:tryptophan synthase alpha chain